tara:strand:- start:1039 stop:1842 length:804 start_codon:yes stop_codon:yes gene_type:complete
MKIFGLIFFLIYTHSTALFSKDFPRIFGCFCEGGVILGKIKKNDSIKIGNRELDIFDNGEFIFAFGRKHKSQVTIIYNDVKKTYTVEKKKYKIERISGLPRGKVEPSKKDLERIRLDQKKIIGSKEIGEFKKIFDERFIMPVEGRLTGFFGSQRILNEKPKRPHYGIDIAQKKGSPIIAPSSGKVKLVAKNMFFTGNTVILDHGLGLISIFAHMDEISVIEEQYVEIGEKLGSVGMTGRATGPHLHWGIYLKDTPVDPLTILNSSFF